MKQHNEVVMDMVNSKTAAGIPQLSVSSKKIAHPGPLMHNMDGHSSAIKDGIIIKVSVLLTL